MGNIEGPEQVTESYPRRLLRMEEVARSLGLSRETVFRLAATGQLPTVAIGRSRRVRAEDLEAWIAGLRGEHA